MLIVCQNCGTAYQIDPATLGPAGRSVRCARCQHVWFNANTEAMSGIAQAHRAQVAALIGRSEVEEMPALPALPPVPPLPEPVPGAATEEPVAAAPTLADTPLAGPVPAEPAVEVEAGAAAETTSPEQVT